MEYSIQTLCNKNMFIKDTFPIHSQNRYIKIFQFLFKIGYHLALCMKKQQFIPFNDVIAVRIHISFNNVGIDGHRHKYLYEPYQIDQRRRQQIISRCVYG